MDEGRGAERPGQRPGDRASTQVIEKWPTRRSGGSPRPEKFTKNPVAWHNRDHRHFPYDNGFRTGDLPICCPGGLDEIV